MSNEWPRISEGTFLCPKAAIGLSPQPREDYPVRFYAKLFDNAHPDSKEKSRRVAGWIDAWGMTSTKNIPPARELIPMTVEQWRYKDKVDDDGISRHLMAIYEDGEFRDLR